ncbi:uncharacterized protein M421DRAFT_423878 [Didymella exigua CBS 183.55]|uniref:C2H2-type domain-containing protein n=1 Tax=Didymella exigua CBS 183.55 TaxID=1150837 RepID=A0A6A5RAR6_9PLEO|nr:uncharacterized protein M421DRAFT_423878 [Didymella exigua CBS 183.55]KAF1925321.1 hypothetical protein M421DRAFT_423878 [Didymella exigua CBS 183.55]
MGQDTSSAGTSPHNSAEASVLICNICSERFIGDYRKRNLSRHRLSLHGNSEPVVCEVLGCQRSYKRSDALKVHLRKAHPNTVSPPVPRKNAAGDSRGKKRQCASV